MQKYKLLKDCKRYSKFQIPNENQLTLPRPPRQDRELASKGRHSVDLRQLRYFLQIAESGSLSKAADHLHIAQPSLSQQLRGLEEELGVELLVRHARGVTPTDLGKILCDHARSILTDIDKAKEIVQSRARDPVGRVSVGLPTSACCGLSLKLFKAVNEAHPGISLHLVEAMTGNLDEWLQIGRLDVALLYDHKAFENVAWTEMMVEELALLGAADAPSIRTGKIPFADLAMLPIVVPGRPHVLRSVIESCSARSGQRLENVKDCDSLTGIMQLVRDGYYTIMPTFAFAEEIARGEIKAADIVNPTPSWRLSVVLSKRTNNCRASQAVAGIMANEIKAMVETGAWRAKLKSSRRQARARKV